MHASCILDCVLRRQLIQKQQMYFYILMHTKWSVCEWVSACVSEWGPQSSWRPLAVGSSPNMTELSLLTQGDWAEGATAHNGGTMAAPLVLMGDTCNRIRVRTPGGRPHGEMVHPHPSPLTTPHPKQPLPVLSHSIKLATTHKSYAEGSLFDIDVWHFSAPSHQQKTMPPYSNSCNYYFFKKPKGNAKQIFMVNDAEHHVFNQ